ncbi:MAG: hypothetical protein IJ680_00580 [Paludibacteraceae bacterium]|nr:hypothetical protein [Paludibacteraceae bacterium]
MNTISDQLLVPRIALPHDVREQQIEQLLQERGAALSVQCVNWPETYGYCPKVKAQVAHDGTSLYIRFEVEGEGLKATCINDNEPVWKDSAVEFFCRQEGEQTYRNFEFNCIGTALASSRSGRDTDVRHFDDVQMKRIFRHASTPRQTFDEIPGIQHWSLTVGIPFDLMGCPQGFMPERMLCNFYKCADETANPHYLSWRPIHTPSPDFHRPEYFGMLILNHNDYHTHSLCSNL